MSARPARRPPLANSSHRKPTDAHRSGDRLNREPLGASLVGVDMLSNRNVMLCILISITTLVLDSCGLGKYINPFIDTPTNVIMADCWISFHITAWQDLNGDGLWGEYEPPLEGVKILPYGPFASITSGYPLLSKPDGQLDIGVWHPGNCYNETYTIVAYPPEVFTPTTPTSISFSIKPTESVYKAQFGFRLQ
jgi:hypothetical protein